MGVGISQEQPPVTVPSLLAHCHSNPVRQPHPLHLPIHLLNPTQQMHMDNLYPQSLFSRILIINFDGHHKPILELILLGVQVRREDMGDYFGGQLRVGLGEVWGFGGEGSALAVFV